MDKSGHKLVGIAGLFEDFMNVFWMIPSGTHINKKYGILTANGSSWFLQGYLEMAPYWKIVLNVKLNVFDSMSSAAI